MYFYIRYIPYRLHISVEQRTIYNNSENTYINKGDDYDYDYNDDINLYRTLCVYFYMLILWLTRL